MKALQTGKNKTVPENIEKGTYSWLRDGALRMELDMEG